MIRKMRETKAVVWAELGQETAGNPGIFDPGQRVLQAGGRLFEPGWLHPGTPSIADALDRMEPAAVGSIRGWW
jgi:hypothetical protein